jgi:hypothetical protein
MGVSEFESENIKHDRRVTYRLTPLAPNPPPPPSTTIHNWGNTPWFTFKFKVVNIARVSHIPTHKSLPLPSPAAPLRFIFWRLLILHIKHKSHRAFIPAFFRIIWLRHGHLNANHCRRQCHLTRLVLPPPRHMSVGRWTRITALCVPMAIRHRQTIPLSAIVV